MGAILEHLWYLLNQYYVESTRGLLQPIIETTGIQLLSYLGLLAKIQIYNDFEIQVGSDAQPLSR